MVPCYVVRVASYLLWLFDPEANQAFCYPFHALLDASAISDPSRNFRLAFQPALPEFLDSKVFLVEVHT